MSLGHDFRWWELEASPRLSSQGPQVGDAQAQAILFDMACGTSTISSIPVAEVLTDIAGSGEATEAFKEWFLAGRALYQHENIQTSITPSQRPPLLGPRKRLVAKPTSPDVPPPLVAAADPVRLMIQNALSCLS